VSLGPFPHKPQQRRYSVLGRGNILNIHSTEDIKNIASETDTKTLLEQYQKIIAELMHCAADKNCKCTVKEFLEKLVFENE
jgi:hypothetical protein